MAQASRTGSRARAGCVRKPNRGPIRGRASRSGSATNYSGFLGQLRRSETTVPLTGPDSSFYGGNFGFRRAVCDVTATFDADLGLRGYRTIPGVRRWTFTGACSNTDSRCGGRRMPRFTIASRWRNSSVFYFLDLHYRQGRMEGTAKAGGSASRMPPLYLFPQLGPIGSCTAPAKGAGGGATCHGRYRDERLVFRRIHPGMGIRQRVTGPKRPWPLVR